MSILKGLRSYYSLFGVRGPLLVAQSRLLKRPTQVGVSVPGVKHQVSLRLRTADITVFEQIFVGGEYEWNWPKNPCVILDAGANIGLTSVFYATKYPDAKIISVEPEESNYQMLRKNVAQYSRVTPVHAALWKENRQLSLSDPDARHDGFQTSDVPGGPSERSRTVRGVTVAKLMEEYSVSFIDILKLDIEGSEKEVFETAEEWIDKVGMIVIELHDRLKPGCSRSVYLGAKEFECEFRRGETVFLSRRGGFTEAPMAQTNAAPPARFRISNFAADRGLAG